MRLLPPFNPGFMFGGEGVVPIISLTEQSGLRFSSTTIDQVTIPSGAQVGDLCVIWMWETGTSGTPPLVTPSGFTIAGTEAWTEGGLDMRWSVAVKVLEAADIGAVRSVHQIGHLMIFRPNRPLRTITTFDYESLNSTGNPGSAVITTTGRTKPVLVFAYYFTTGNAFITGEGFSTGSDGSWNLGYFPGDRTFRWEFQLASALANVTISGAAWANRNFTGGCGIEVD